MKNYTLLFILLFLANMVSAQCPVIFNFDTVYCQNDIPDPLPASSGGVTGIWTPATITTNTPGTFTFVFRPDSVCTDSTVVVVRVNANPTATVTNNGPYCSYDVISLSSGGGTSYSWIGPNSFSSASQNPTRPASANGGVYIVVVTNASGCTATATTTVTVNPIPSATANNSGPYCSYNVISLSSGGGTSYSWIGPNSFSSASQNPTRPASGNGGVYTVVVTNASGCTATATTTVTVNPIPSATANNSGPYCSYDVISLGSGGGTIYSWSGPNSFSSASQNPTRPASGNGGVYTVVVTNASGCTATATTAVTVNAVPTATANNSGQYCSYDVISLSSGGGTTYSWIGPNSFSSASQNPTRPASGNGGVYTVVVTNASGCTATATTTVTVNPIPSATANNSGPYCSYDVISLGSGGGISYSWSGPNSFSSASQNPTRPASGNGGVYTVVVTNASGCTATASTSVTVNPTPTITPIANQNFCAGASSAPVTIWSAVPGSSYTWTNSNTAIGLPGAGFSVVNAFSGINNGTTPVAANIIVVSEAASCTARDTFTITVNPNPIVSAGNDITICSGQPLALSATGALAYNWTSNVVNNQVFYPQVSNVYQVTGYNQYNCAATDFVSVTVNASPVLDLGPDFSVCNGELINLSTQNANTVWSGITDSSGSSVNFNPTSSGFLVARLTSGNCTVRDSIFITVRPRPNVSAGNDQNICSGQSVILSASGALNYIWSGGVNNNQAFFPGSSSVYTVIGYNQFNCSATDSVTVNVTTSPQINLGANVEICFGDSIRIDANANAQWSGILTDTAQVISFVPLQSGYLSCEVSNNGCSIKDSIFVQVNPIPYPFISGPDEVCANSYWQRYAVAPGTNAYNWTISNGEILAGNGTNEIFVHWFDSAGGRLTVNEYIWTSGCSSEDGLNVSFIDTALAPAEIRLLYNGGNILHTTLDYPQMSWGYESVQTHIPVYLGVYTQYCQIQNFDPSNFNYWVEIGDGNGCITKSYYNAPTFPIAVNGIDVEISAKVYPNPANDLIYIEFNALDSGIYFQVTDLSGKLISTGLLQNTVNSISVEGLSSGLYFVQLRNEKRSSIYKIVKL